MAGHCNASQDAQDAWNAEDASLASGRNAGGSDAGSVFADDTISLTQEGYIDRVLERFGMANCTPIGTPMEKDKPGMKGGGDKPCDRTLYLQLDRKSVV